MTERQLNAFTHTHTPWWRQMNDIRVPTRESNPYLEKPPRGRVISGEHVPAYISSVPGGIA